MKKRKPWRTFFIIAVCALFTLAVSAAEERYVYDFAGILPEEYKESMRESSGALMDLLETEVAAITVKNLGGAEPADYISNFVSEHKLGGPSGDSYLITLFSEEDQLVWLATGPLLKRYISNKTLERDILGDVMELGISSGDYSGAIYEGHKASIAAIYAAAEEFAEQGGKTKDSETAYMIILAGSLLILLRAFFIMRKSRQRHQRLYSGATAYRRRSLREREPDIEYSHINEKGNPGDD